MMQRNRPFTQGVVTYLLVVGFFYTLYYLTKFPVPKDNKDILLILIGSLSTKFSDSIAYWLNSTSSSRSKDALIAGMTPPPTGGPDAQP